MCGARRSPGSAPAAPSSTNRTRSRSRSGKRRLRSSQKGDAGVIDLCHLDEVGFAMTLPTTYSWFLQGERLEVPYEAPQGRRVNAIGAHFTHGPEAGRLEYQSWAVVPKSRAKQPRLSDEARAAAHGLRVDEVGPIDAERVVAFLWRGAGGAAGGPPDRQHGRALLIALDK